MVATTSVELNMNAQEVREHILSLVGGFISEVDTNTNVFLNGAPHPIHLLPEAALEFISGSKDERGLISLYWVSEQTPEQLGISKVIPGVPGLSKPRVISAEKKFETRGGIPVAITSGESIDGLPEIPEGVTLISSGITAGAAARLGMTNILAPGAQVRSLPDAEGRTKVLGCFGFIQGS